MARRPRPVRGGQTVSGGIVPNPFGNATVSLPMWASESARLRWWPSIGVPWQRLIEAATGFEDEALDQLGASVEHEPWEPPWHERPAKQYADALAEYLNEYSPSLAAQADKP